MISNTNNINSVPEKKISGVIYGNPNENAGYEPLLFMGNFGTKIPYERVGGFIKDFYSYIIDSTQTIYKYHSYNVNSVGATRNGILLIAISIPKGYKIDGGVSPYDVLNQLKNEFIRLYMTPKGLEVYEYKDKNLNKIIDKSIFDSVLNGFKLVPHKTPYHAMSSEGKEGVITLSSELQFAELFNDVQYSELKGYKEIFVSTGVVKNPKLIPIQGIEIPRKPNYAIKVNNTFREYVKDINKINSYQANKQYYDNPVVSFTIADLIENPNKYRNVQLDQANEVISVSIESIPKKEEVAIRINDQIAQRYFRSIRPRLKVSGSNHPLYNVAIADNLTFTLVGEQLKNLEQPSAISLTCEDKKEYIIKNNSLSRGANGRFELLVEVEKVKKVNQHSVGVITIGEKNINQQSGDYDLVRQKKELEEKIEDLKKTNKKLLIFGIVACILVGLGTWGIPKLFGGEKPSKDKGAIIYANDNQKNNWRQLLNACVKNAENAKKEIETAESNLRNSNIKEKEKKESLKTIDTYKGILSNSKSMADAFKTLLEYIGDEEVAADALEKYNKILQILAEVNAILASTNSDSSFGAEVVSEDIEGVVHTESIIHNEVVNAQKDNVGKGGNSQASNKKENKKTNESKNKDTGRDSNSER